MGHRIDELPVITTPSDSDKVVVEHDSLTSQITLARLIAAERSRLDQLESALQSIGDGAFEIGFSNTSSILTQAETIMSGQGTGTYFGWLSSYGHQDTVGTPENDNYYVTLNAWNSGNAKLILESTAHDKVFFKARGGSSGWDANWTKRPGRTEIESINSGFTNAVTSSDKITFTPLVGSAYANYGGCYYYKKGNQVHVHIGMSGLTANSQQDVFNLPSGYKPLGDMVFIGSGGSTYTAFAKAVIYSSGTVRVSSADTYAMIDCFFVYAS